VEGNIVSKGLKIGNQRDSYIKIDVVSRTHPGCDDYWDGNWLNSEVRIRSGGFMGKANPKLRADEFRSFLQEVEALSASAKGTAKFRSMEENLEINITHYDKIGLVAKGTLIDRHDELGNKLAFSITVRDSELNHIADQLREIMGEFPVLGK
jgi:hypothetical protein